MQNPTKITGELRAELFEILYPGQVDDGGEWTVWKTEDKEKETAKTKKEINHGR